MNKFEELGEFEKFEELLIISKEKIELEYHKVKKMQGEFNKDCYGIIVIKKEKEKIEKTVIEDITSKENFIDNIISTLKRNLVMPISVKEIIYDIIP